MALASSMKPSLIGPTAASTGPAKEMERWCLERAGRRPARLGSLHQSHPQPGPAGGAYMTLPVDMARTGRFAWISGGQGSCNYTYVENVVDALLLAARTPAAHGERFIVNDGVTTWRGLLEPFLDPLGLAIPDYLPAQLAALPRFGDAFRWRDLAQAVISSERVREVAKRSALVRRRFGTHDAGRRTTRRTDPHLFLPTHANRRGADLSSGVAGRPLQPREDEVFRRQGRARVGLGSEARARLGTSIDS